MKLLIRFGFAVNELRLIGVLLLQREYGGTLEKGQFANILSRYEFIERFDQRFQSLFSS